MTKYEKLLSEYDGALDISEHKMKSSGLYADGCIWINKNLSECEKVCILAEEIGHYHTSVGDILNQNDIQNARQEWKARKWAYEKILPIEDIMHAIKIGNTEPWDIAEYLDVDEKTLREALEYYNLLNVV